jgi:UDP-N-acetylmuramoyl-L-alanyl-D-glutamate--2,6-diaminopimelate ligase
VKFKELLRDVVILSSTADMETEIRSALRFRKVSPGDLFVAIEGFETDGHEYIPRAWNGGRRVICQKAPVDGVPHVYGMLSRRRSRQFRQLFRAAAEKMKFICITGTTKVHHDLPGKTPAGAGPGRQGGLIGTNRNLIGEGPSHGAVHPRIL